MSIQTDENNIPFIDLGEGYKIRLEFEDLAEEEYIEKAKNELRETPEVATAAIEELRALIKGKCVD
jgi:prefoldin subunit 5